MFFSSSELVFSSMDMHAYASCGTTIVVSGVGRRRRQLKNVEQENGTETNVQISTCDQDFQASNC